MEANMTTAARVRREFRLGRPPRALREGEQPEPMHPAAAWKRATDALADFRARMTAATLQPEHVIGAIVYVTLAEPNEPRFLLLEDEGRTAESLQEEAFEQLSRGDALALGMIFRQFDAEAKQQSTFPHQFFGLSPHGVTVLRNAAEKQVRIGERFKTQN